MVLDRLKELIKNFIIKIGCNSTCCNTVNCDDLEEEVIKIINNIK